MAPSTLCIFSQLDGENLIFSLIGFGTGGAAGVVEASWFVELEPVVRRVEARHLSWEVTPLRGWLSAGAANCMRPISLKTLIYLIDPKTGFERSIATLPFGLSSGLELAKPLP
jgi:hypothetical protein